MIPLAPETSFIAGKNVLGPQLSDVFVIIEAISQQAFLQAPRLPEKLLISLLSCLSIGGDETKDPSRKMGENPQVIGQ